MDLHLPIRTILQIFGNDVVCDIDAEFVAERITTLDAAGPKDLVFVLDRGSASVFDSISSDSIKKSNAGVFVATNRIVDDKKYVLVKDVFAALTNLALFFQTQLQNIRTPPVIAYDAIIDPTAVIAPGAIIGSGTRIDALAFVGRKCRVGCNTVLYPGVKLLDLCTIGDRTIIHAGTVVGSDGFGYQVEPSGLKKIPQIGSVYIGNDVEIGANCMLDRASFDKTIIGDGVKIDNGVHVAHNVVIGACSAILAQTGIAGSARIGIGCQIGGQVGIKDHVTIGNGVKIVSKSAIMNDLKDGDVVAGVPALPFGQWKKLVVSMNKLPEVIKQWNEVRPMFSKSTKSLWQRLFG